MSGEMSVEDVIHELTKWRPGRDAFPPAQVAFDAAIAALRRTPPAPPVELPTAAEEAAHAELARILGTIHPVTGCPLGFRADCRALGRLLEAHRAEFEGAGLTEVTTAFGRIETALQTIGFRTWDTGGGCTAWGLNLPKERQLLITGEYSCAPTSIDAFVNLCVNGEDGCDEIRSDVEIAHALGAVNEMLTAHRDTPHVHALEKGLLARGFSLTDRNGIAWVKDYPDGVRYLTLCQSESAIGGPVNDLQSVCIALHALCGESNDELDSDFATVTCALSIVDEMLLKHP